MTNDLTALPPPPGWNDLEHIQATCTGFETTTGLFVLHDPARLIGAVYSPRAGRWTAWRPVNAEDLLEAVRLMDADAAAAELTAAALERMTRH